MRADAIRYLLLYQLGGLYLDLDYEMLSPFDLRHHAVVLPLETDLSLHEGGARQYVDGGSSWGPSLS